MELETELNKFKANITNNFKNSTDNFIYLRLSAINNALPTENERIKDTLDKLQADFNKLLELYPTLKENGFKLFVEVKSAYKNSVRDVFIDLYSNYLFNDIKNIKQLLEIEDKPKEKNLYIASFDRLSRVFFYSLTFQVLRKLRNINVFTLSEEERNFELTNKNILDKEHLEQTFFIFGLMMFSSSASKHSEDMSYKIKKRVDRTGDTTISTKTGKKWGTEKTISDEMREKIIKRFKSFTAQEISEQTDIFKIKFGVRERISINTIKKIIQEQNL